MIPTDPREKYTSLGERPKVYPRPSSGRGRKQVPDVTATLAFGGPTVDRDDTGPKTNKVLILPVNERSLGQPQVEADEKMLQVYHTTVSILETSGVHMLMKFGIQRYSKIMRQYSRVESVLTKLQSFNYVTGIVSDSLDFSQKGVIPFHIWAVCCLLTYEDPSTDIFRYIIKEWTEIIKKVKSDDAEDINAIVIPALEDHVYQSAIVYRKLLTVNTSSVFCTVRGKGIENWIGHLKALVEASSSSFKASIIIRSMQDLARLPSAHEGNTFNHKEGNFTKMEEMSAMRNAGGVLKGPSGDGTIKALAKDVKEIKAMMRMLLEKQNRP